MTESEKSAKMINQAIQEHKEHCGMETDLISDGWHTFGDLYDFRLAYNAMAFNAIYSMEQKIKSMKTVTALELMRHVGFDVHKSWKHHDGEYCFGEEKKWFIVAAKLPTGIITNHYKAEYWDLFKIPEMEKSILPFDGHTAHDALDRIFQFLKQK